MCYIIDILGYVNQNIKNFFVLCKISIDSGETIVLSLRLINVEVKSKFDSMVRKNNMVRSGDANSIFVSSLILNVNFGLFGKQREFVVSNYRRTFPNST